MIELGNEKEMMQQNSIVYNAIQTRNSLPLLKKTSSAFLNVGIVIPTLNEEKNIGAVLDGLKSLGFDNILVIDGQSKDCTVEAATNNGAKVILQQTKGKGAAIKQVLNNNYLNADAIILMDADGSMSPEEIPALIKTLESGADIVKGSRFLKGGYTQDMSAIRRLGNKLMVTAVNLLWSTKFTDLCYGFIILNKRAIQNLAPVVESQNFEIETEIVIKAVNRGLIVKEVPSVELSRRNGESNLHTFRDGYRIFKTIFREFMKPTKSN